MVGEKRRYSADLLAEVADMVKRKDISLNRAAKEYGIPKTTLQDKVNDTVYSFFYVYMLLHFVGKHIILKTYFYLSCILGPWKVYIF